MLLQLYSHQQLHASLLPNITSASSLLRPCPCRPAQVKLQLVGCDAVLLVEGRELLYFKLLDVDAYLSAAAPGAALRPGDSRLTLALNAGDVAVRDLQVSTFDDDPS